MQNKTNFPVVISYHIHGTSYSRAASGNRLSVVYSPCQSVGYGKSKDHCQCLPHKSMTSSCLRTLVARVIFSNVHSWCTYCRLGKFRPLLVRHGSYFKRATSRVFSISDVLDDRSYVLATVGNCTRRQRARVANSCTVVFKVHSSFNTVDN